jgi:hypothetical protein
MRKNRTTKTVVVTALSLSLILSSGATAFGAAGNAATAGTSVAAFGYGQNDPIGATKEYLVTYKNLQGKVEALEVSKDVSILIVASSGNDGTNLGVGETIEYPANLPNVIAVQAVDKSLKRAGFSGTGRRAEISAPGVNIASTSYDGGYEYRSGTSMATPYIAGVLAIMKQANPKKTANELRDMLDDNAIDLGHISGRDTQYGFGFPDLTKLVPAKQEAPTPAPTVPTEPTPAPIPTVDSVALKDATHAVEYAEKYKQYKIYINRAVDKVKNLPASNEKNILVSRMQAIGAMKDVVITPIQDSKNPETPVTPAPTPTVDPVALKEAISAVQYAEKYKQYKIYINRAVDKVTKLPASKEKNNLISRMQAIGAMQDAVITPIGDSTQPVTPQPTTPPPAPKVKKADLDQATRYVGCAEKYKYKVYFNKAKELVSKLPDCPEKVALQARLDALKQ